MNRLLSFHGFLIQVNLFVTFKYTSCLLCAKFGIRCYYSQFQRENARTDIDTCVWYYMCLVPSTMFINLCINGIKPSIKNTDILNIPFLFQLTLFHKYTIQRSRHNTLGESEIIRLLVGEGYVCWERKQWRFFPRFFFFTKSTENVVP